MASLVTGTAIGNNLTRIGFSSVLHRESVNKLYFTKRNMIARDTGGESAFERQGGLPIRSVEALNNRRAQQVRVGMLNQLTTNRSAVTGARSPNVRTYGSASTNVMVDQEEAAALRNMAVWVEQSKHSTSTVTPEIQDLRTEFKVTAQFAGLLTDWMAAEDEENFLDAFYDQFSGHVVAASLASAADPPAANLQYAGGAADNASLTSTDRLSPAELVRMWTWLETNNINPIKVDGEECYVLLVHPYVYADLFRNSEWIQTYRDAWQRAASKKDNPLFSSADAVYMNIYIHSFNRIRSITALPNVRRCLLLGADAVLHGMTVRPRLVRRKEDNYEDVYGIGIKSIHGESRCDFAPQSGATLNQAMAIWGLYTNAAA